VSSQSPPTETGQRIATLDRGPDEQVRINWSEYESHPYISLRMWTRDRRGRWWPDSKRGLSIRIRELGQVAAAIAAAIDHAEEIRAPWTTLPADHPGRRGVRRRTHAARRPVVSSVSPVGDDQGEHEPFDEFS
jgi:hypothetical protein